MYWIKIWLVFCLALGIYSCSDMKNPNRLDSDEFDSKEKRIEILKNEIIPKSDFENAEFELFNVNGFSNSRTTVPGASSWDYRFAIKVKPQDLDKWTEGMVKADSASYNIGWTTEITKQRENEWAASSQPEFYTRKGENVALVVYRPEAIIFKRTVSH